MILINVKYRPKPKYVEVFPEKLAKFTRETRREPGNIFFDLYRSTDDPGVYVLTEAFHDDAAEAHVTSPHFAEGMETMRPLLLETPEIINTLIPGKTEWDRMAELQID